MADVLLWQRYDNNKMADMCYYGNVILHLQQYSHRLNLFNKVLLFFSKACHAQAVSHLLFTAEPWFDSRSLHVIFVVDKVSIEQVFLRMLRFSPLSILHHRSILIFTDMLLLPERQVSEAREPSKKQFCFGNPRIMDRKIFSFFFSSKGHHIFADPWPRS